MGAAPRALAELLGTRIGAGAGKINFHYEAPLNPELRLRSDRESAEVLAERVIEYLTRMGRI